LDFSIRKVRAARRRPHAAGRKPRQRLVCEPTAGGEPEYYSLVKNITVIKKTLNNILYRNIYYIRAPKMRLNN
jgi:hypothetical protein